MNLRSIPALALCALATAPAALHAQMHHVDKAEQVTRAVGVYEWTGDLKKPNAARLVPVTVFLDGHMQNGGTFLAQPVPFALGIGNIYSIEKAGDPFGTLELNLARDVAARHAADDEPVGGSWYGYGKFLPPAPPKKSNLKPSAKPVTLAGSDDDERPHFVTSRDNGDADKTPATPGTTDSDRPALRRTTTATVPDDDPDKPTLGHRDPAPATDPKAKKQKKEKPGGYVTSAGSLNDDPDRPTIRRGQKPSDDVEPLMGTPADLHQAVAVSDPAPHDLHLFTRDWDGADEREKTLAAMQALAAVRVKEYLATNALTPAAAMPAPVVTTADVPAPRTSTPKAVPPSTTTQDAAPPKLVRTPNGVNTSTDDAETPAPPKLVRTPEGVSTATIHNDPPPAAKPAATTAKPATTSAKRKPGKAAPAPVLAPLFADEQINAYELSYGGLPTFVYSAKIPTTNTRTPPSNPVVYVTVVAQRTPSGTLQTSLSSITDSAHLDRVPWLRFVDVVDADGSHRASLIFELRAQHTRQFAVYRLIAANAEQTFLTSTLE